MSPRRTFTYQEAQALFPLVAERTRAAVAQIEALVNQVQSLEEGEARRSELEQVFETIVQEWAEEMVALGCEVKGLWLVDWDCGNGYYCWKYPEESLSHFHGYEEGFEGRVPLQ